MDHFFPPPKVFIIALCAITLSACATEPLKPWERDILAQKHMQVGGDSMTSTTDGKIYFSREASRGVSSFGGGGCGCN